MVLIKKKKIFSDLGLESLILPLRSVILGIMVERQNEQLGFSIHGPASGMRNSWQNIHFMT